MKYLFYIIFSLSLFSDSTIAQGLGDSLLVKRAGVGSPIKSMIRGWQFISNRTDILNCQFHIGCSQYAINAIEDEGSLKGALIATNRLVRCNPLARFSYSRDEFGYLIDDTEYLQLPTDINNPNSAMKWGIEYAMCLMPGVQEVRLGKWSDAVILFGIIAFGSYKGIERLKEDAILHGSITLSITAWIYFANVYSAEVRARTSRQQSSK